MSTDQFRRLIPTIAVLVSALAFTRSAAGDLARTARAISFNREILPILSDHCFACHGPDAGTRKAKLRLDTKEGAFDELRGGGNAFVPGKPNDSEALRRVSSKEADEIMPPPGKGKPLTPQEIESLKKWVADGAPWTQHWAFVAPKRPQLPDVKDASWPRTPIDHFILARLDHEGLRPSPEADKPMLLRRVTFDLSGLPPTLAELDDFLADASPHAYERVVDRLLSSPRYGEHMARYWLDAVRYADTHGLHFDNFREIWPYRDRVVRAFNENLSFDKFVTEQLAGDLLPKPTPDELVATGFVRCNLSTNEGGSINEECYVRNVVDRVDAFGTVMLGLTAGCARCHDHKYDPLTQRDYYSLFAFFNSLQEAALDGNAAQYPPVMTVSTPDRLAEIERAKERIAAVRKEIDAAVATVKVEESTAEAKKPIIREDYIWIEDEMPAGAKSSVEAWEWVTEPEHPVLSGRRSMRRQAGGLSQHYFTEAKPGLVVGSGDAFFAYVYLDPANPPKEIMLQWNTGDWSHRAYWGENLIPFGADNTASRMRLGPLPPLGEWVRLQVPIKDLMMRGGTEIAGWAFTQFGGTVYWDKAGISTRVPQGSQSFATLSGWLRRMQTVNGAGLPKPVQEAVRAGSKRTEAQTERARAYYIEYACAATRPTFEPLHAKLAAAEAKRDGLVKGLPSTMVCKELPQPTQAFILKRGEYDQKGAPVTRSTPAFLPPFPTDAPHDRLGLARWLLRPEHPLTARVAVNRFWLQLFGTGLVKTAEDFGTQGEPPSHSELLDWLAVDFRESGWDVKRLMRQIVLSAAYRQSSRLTQDRLAKDPANRLLSRGPRFRLDGEMLRDQALDLGGLLVEKRGGPPVKPPQPAGLWEAVGYLTSNTRNFVADSGAEKVHRRSLYTFWKRTSPPPQMTTLDAPSREACCVRRERTNTPLQALLMMNERQYIEAARGLADRAMKSGGSGPEDPLVWMFRSATCRTPDRAELSELVSAYRDFLAKYAADPEATKKLLGGPTSPSPEWAAYTMVANLILNLDEVLTKG
jgi:hypothetical protein